MSYCSYFFVFFRIFSYFFVFSTTITGSRNMVRVMGHESSSGSSSRSASGASGTSLRALAERRVRTPWVVSPDVGSGAADVLRRLEGAIERTSGVAPGCALCNTDLGRVTSLKSFGLDLSSLRCGFNTSRRTACALNEATRVTARRRCPPNAATFTCVTRVRASRAEPRAS